MIPSFLLFHVSSRCNIKSDKSKYLQISDVIYVGTLVVPLKSRYVSDFFLF